MLLPPAWRCWQLWQQWRGRVHSELLKFQSLPRPYILISTSPLSSAYVRGRTPIYLAGTAAWASATSLEARAAAGAGRQQAHELPVTPFALHPPLTTTATHSHILFQECDTNLLSGDRSFGISHELGGGGGYTASGKSGAPAPPLRNRRSSSGMAESGSGLSFSGEMPRASDSPDKVGEDNLRYSQNY